MSPDFGSPPASLPQLEKQCLKQNTAFILFLVLDSMLEDTLNAQDITDVFMIL